MKTKYNIFEKKIVLIGAGNVASHLAPALLKAGLNLCQIFSRTTESARELSSKTGISFTSQIYEIYPDADIYIFCISDDALAYVYKTLNLNHNALILHTCGSVSIDVFSTARNPYGVLYPLQTFSKKRELDFSQIPIFIEGINSETRDKIKILADLLSQKVIDASSEKRKKLHIAAVFANNFVNSLYKIASDIMESEQLSFSFLRPLIDETANKVMSMEPCDAQTGPARRGDNNVISNHKTLLKDDKELLQIYSLMSDYIKEMYATKELEDEDNIKPENTEPMMLSLWDFQ